MPTALVTGAAGFIGSALCRRLLDDGVRVHGIDNFDPYYDRRLKERNLQPILAREGFTFREGGLESLDLGPELAGIDWVFHQAARAGVRGSWGEDFRHYVNANLVATQRLLEALRQGSTQVTRFVFASSSSVYGEGPGGPVTEEAPRRPISPYGVTKLAGEGLVAAYQKNYGLPAVTLRYFTVYGPGQRPDMAFHRFVKAYLSDGRLEIYGDGRQTRDFTYIADAVEANLLAARNGRLGAVYNIGGGSPAAVLEVLDLLATITGRQAERVFDDRQKGDPLATAADTTLARRDLGFRPSVTLEEGLRRMVAWMEALLTEVPPCGRCS